MENQERKATAGIITFIITFILSGIWWNLEYSYLLRLSFEMEMASSLMALIFVLGIPAAVYALLFNNNEESRGPATTQPRQNELAKPDVVIKTAADCLQVKEQPEVVPVNEEETILSLKERQKQLKEELAALKKAERAKKKKPLPRVNILYLLGAVVLLIAVTISYISSRDEYDFYHNNAVIVVPNLSYYHVYGCPNIDYDWFLIYTRAQAEFERHEPCPYCCDKDKDMGALSELMKKYGFDPYATNRDNPAVMLDPETGVQTEVP